MNTSWQGDSNLERQQRGTLDLALNAVAKTAGITAEAVETSLTFSAPPQDRTKVDITANGNTFTYAAEIKNIDRISTLQQIKRHFEESAVPSLLVSPRISAEIAEKLRALDVQFIDTSGNAFLRGPGLLIFVKGQRPTEDNPIEQRLVKPSRLGTPTALRAIFILLADPQMLRASYRVLSQAANVSLGTIGWVLSDLEIRGYTGTSNGVRRILARDRLIQEWAINFPNKLRPKLNSKRFHAPDPHWWKNVDLKQFDACWGGEVAADKWTGYLKPENVTIYMKPDDWQKNLTALVIKNKLRADPEGEVEVVEAFWDLPPHEGPADTVPPLLIYADLMATMDPRNFETAQLLYRKLINGHPST
jgi:hypothetical protein